MRRYLSYFLRLVISSEPSREKRVLAIALSILMASLLWVVVTLNQSYKVTYSFPVKVINVPDSLQLTSKEFPSLRIELSGLGFDLMLEQLQASHDTIEVDFVPLINQANYLSSYRFQSQLARGLGNEIKIENILTDRMTAQVVPRVARRVPVAFRARVQLEPTMQLEDLPDLRDDSVTLYGPQTWIDTTMEWPTQPDYVLKVEQDTNLAIPLAQPPVGCAVNPKHVAVKVSPRRYTEALLQVPVEVSDAPSGTSVRLSHQVIEIACLVPMDSYQEVLDEAQRRKVRIPFANLNPEIPSLIPTLNLPESVKPIYRSPQAISYVILRK